MYGGVSGELLWKDATKPYGLGMELSWARQREPDTAFGFGDYDTLTGHGSLYWDSGWNGVGAQLDVGRYLAEDWGATLTLSRRFRSGWEVSGFVTATDADTSSARSRFANGVNVTIPLQWATPFATRRTTGVALKERGRDDGARLDTQNRLYDTVREGDRAWIGRNWEAFWQ